MHWSREELLDMPLVDLDWWLEAIEESTHGGH
jgi:hypothetical protein